MHHEHFIIPVLSSLWVYGMMGAILFYSAMIFLGRKLMRVNKEPMLRQILVSIFVIREIFLHAYIVNNGMFTWQDSLPLHLCGISYLLGTYYLFQPKIAVFEFLLMLSFGGALQAFLTPELTHGFSTYFYVDYYFSHGAIIFASMYGIFVLGHVPRKWSWAKVIVWGHVVLLSVGILNYFLSSNYIYLCEAPKVENPFLLGPYPMHLLGFELFGCLHIIVLYFIATNLKLKPINVRVQ